MPRYFVSFMRWEVLGEYVDAENEDAAKEKAREQLERREDPEPVGRGLDHIGTEVDEDEDPA